MAGKFDLKKSPSGKYMFNLKAGNGQILLTSEFYESKAAAENGIASVKKNAADDGRYERKESKKGEAYFALKAANGQIIGKSEIYSSKAAMVNGIESVKSSIRSARTDDATTKDFHKVYKYKSLDNVSHCLDIIQNRRLYCANFKELPG
jgi:uncharacterized protein YegP (UPF0339 family)